MTPRGAARVRVTPSPWLLELMGGPGVPPAEASGGDADAAA